MNIVVAVIIFAFSICAYSLMRHFDVKSTRVLAAKLDLEKHEMNPLMVRLAKRFGIDSAFKITWAIFAIPIAIADVILNSVWSVNLPVFAFVFGFTHLLAAANNIEIAYTVRHSTTEEVERRTMDLAAELRALNWTGRMKLLMERNAFTFLTAVYSLIIIIDLYYAGVIANITGLSYLTVAMPNAGNVALLSLLIYFTSVAIGLYLMSNRLAKMPPEKTVARPQGFEVDIGIVEEGLQLARSRSATTVLFQIDQG